MTVLSFVIDSCIDRDVQRILFNHTALFIAVTAAVVGFLVGYLWNDARN